MIDTYILVENPEGKRPVGRCTHKWEDNIKMDLKELECMWSTRGLGYDQMGSSYHHGKKKTRIQ